MNGIGHTHSIASSGEKACPNGTLGCKLLSKPSTVPRHQLLAVGCYGGLAAREGIALYPDQGVEAVGCYGGLAAGEGIAPCPSMLWCQITKAHCLQPIQRRMAGLMGECPACPGASA
jgi:hypothetical protein